jgi:hypothetical protein
MMFKHFSLTAVFLVVFCTALRAGPVQELFDITNNNFALDPVGSGGGGSHAQIGKGLNVEVFSVDFANNIYGLQKNYSVYETTLTTGSDLSLTRFGSVSPSNFTTITITGDAADSSVVNSAAALARYQMAAYLTTTYKLASSATSRLYNDGVQDAIWQLLDPKGESALLPKEPTGVDPSAALKSAAQWYTKSVANNTLNSFLTNFRIVSDTSLKTSCGGALIHCGFQEQITVVPEPRHLALMLIGLLIVSSAAFRKLRPARRSDT